MSMKVIPEHAELTVIGGGLAGSLAALTAAKTGRKVVLLKRSAGATALSSGALDVAPPPGPGPKAWWERGTTIAEGVQVLCETNPFHPYSIAGGLTAVRKALKAFEALALELPLAPINLEGPALVLANEQGLLKPTASAAPSMVRLDLSALGGKPIGLTEFPSWPALNADFTARSITFLSTQYQGPIRTVVKVPISYFKRQSDLLSTPFMVARELDSDEAESRFIDGVAEALKDVALQGLLLPPILSISNPEKLIRLMERQAGFPCAELLALPPAPVPGWRLDRALEAALVAEGVKVIPEKVDGFESHNGSITQVKTAGQSLETEKVILATGRFLGGGLTGRLKGQELPAHPLLRESIFDLPIYLKDEVIISAPMDQLANRPAFEYNPLFYCGIQVDQQMRPLNHRGGAAYNNLFAAGSVIGGYDPMADGCGLGTALVTGIIAGTEASKEVSS